MTTHKDVFWSHETHVDSSVGEIVIKRLESNVDVQGPFGRWLILSILAGHHTDLSCIVHLGPKRSRYDVNGVAVMGVLCEELLIKIPVFVHDAFLTVQLFECLRSANLDDGSQGTLY